MRVDSEDRYSEEPAASKFPKLPLALVALLLVAATVWFFNPDQAEQAAPEQIADTQPAQQPPVSVVAPDIPQVEATPQPTAPSASDTPSPPPPALSLDNSDTEVREALSPTLTGSVFDQALAEENLLERGTAFFDAAANGLFLREALPIPGPSGRFRAIEVDGKLVANPENYQRYDIYVEAIAALDADSLTAAFHRFRPLLEEAYATLGYQAEDMDNALILALDKVIAAPRLEEPATLVEHINRYAYEDQTLEDLSPLAGQLLRMGPQHQAVIQQKARELRAALLSP